MDKELEKAKEEIKHKQQVIRQWLMDKDPDKLCKRCGEYHWECRCVRYSPMASDFGDPKDKQSGKLLRQWISESWGSHE